MIKDTANRNNELKTTNSSPPTKRHSVRLRKRQERAFEVANRFESLPDAARIRQPVVEVLLQISSATVWRRVQAGQLPEPSRYGRITSWRVGDIRKLLEAV